MNSLLQFYLSYGFPPHACAALLTNQIALSVSVYRNKTATYQELLHVSPQQYTGISVGIMKQAHVIRNQKYLRVKKKKLMKSTTVKYVFIIQYMIIDNI